MFFASYIGTQGGGGTLIFEGVRELPQDPHICTFSNHIGSLSILYLTRCRCTQLDDSLLILYFNIAWSERKKRKNKQTMSLTLTSLMCQIWHPWVE